MQRSRYMNKKVAAIGLAVGVVLGAGGTAFAYFTAPGNGVGSAKTGTTSALSISQVDPAYDSLVTDGNYIQDQTYGGAGVSEFGNEVNLASNGQLSDVVVAMRNWGPTAFSTPITFNIYSPGATAGSVGSVIATDTATFSFQPAIDGNSDPSVSNITFDFSSQDLTLSGPVVYGIAFDASSGPPSSLNVALSSSNTNLTVGTDEYPGHVFVNTSTVAGWDSGAGTCNTLTAGVFEAANVWCDDVPADNAGAYGNANNADIPAVEFNVVGGRTGALPR